jgi:HD superfamily phosphohydrolase
MSHIRAIPEVAGLESAAGVVRLAPELDVPLTERVRRLVDSPEFRRLARIPQLGLVSLVYPAATHSRFEHSLGVYRLALLFLRHLAGDARFSEAVSREDGELFLVAALLHDLGHWPFCHPIEDIRLDGVPCHEEFISRFVESGDVADCLREDWDIDPRDLVSLLSEKQSEIGKKILSSLLSGPIDIDKLDYLSRDSLHAGVPYGRNFDQGRLIGSLCLNEAGDGLAISAKGKTAAEMMVFARYVMFSEVYWHHGVRSATAMLQRAFFLLRDQLALEELFSLTEADVITELRRAGSNGPAGALLEGLFGPRRALYKRLAQFSFFETREVYDRVARRPYGWLVRCAHELAPLLSVACGEDVAPHDLLIDAPPVEKEVEFRIEVHYAKEGCYRLLEDVSPVVRTLAKEQFDDYVKRVRVFAHPRIVEAARAVDTLPDLLAAAAQRADEKAGD